MVGGLAVIAALIFGLVFFLKKKQRNAEPANQAINNPARGPDMGYAAGMTGGATQGSANGYYGPGPVEKEAPVPAGQGRAEVCLFRSQLMRTLQGRFLENADSMVSTDVFTP